MTRGLNLQDPPIEPPGTDSALILDGPGPLSCEQFRSAAQQNRFCAHIGLSMNHTLDHSDLLEVSPLGERLPVVGDVILCVPPGGSQAVVHRVVRAGPDGIATRGDNNAFEDGWRLHQEDIHGRVVAAWRGGRRRGVAGGRAGQLQALWVRARRGLDRAVTPVLHPFYHALETSGVVRRLAPAGLRPLLVSFQTVAGPQWKLMIGRREVGRYDRRLGRWLIRRPYRLLVDERTLPEAAAPSRAREPATGTSGILSEQPLAGPGPRQ